MISLYFFGALCGWHAGNWHKTDRSITSGINCQDMDNGALLPNTAARQNLSIHATTEQKNRLILLSENTELLHAEIHSLTVQELTGLIDLISSRASIDGLSAEDTVLVGELVSRLFDVDPDSILDWIAAHSNGRNRRLYFKMFLDTASRHSPSEALAFAEKYYASTKDAVFFPRNFLGQMSDLGSDHLLRALKLTVGKTDQITNLPNEYPGDFDYQDLAEGIVKLDVGLPRDADLQISTVGFFASWLQTDADAAYRWFVSIPPDDRDSLGGIASFFSGYSKVALPEDYGTFAAQVTMSDLNSDMAWEDASMLLMQYPDYSVTQAFVTEVSRSISSNTVYQKLLEQTNVGGGNFFDAHRRILFNMAPEGIREEYLRLAPEHALRSLGFLK